MSDARRGPRVRGIRNPSEGTSLSHTPISASDLELLRRYDTPTICNVIEVFNVRPRNTGYCDSRIRACFPEMPPMVGYACTATYTRRWTGT